jgi:Phosphoesterase family
VPIAKRFTILDRHVASLLGPTMPNRQYVHSATSEGRKDSPRPLESGLYRATTIWDRLGASNVPAAYYYSNLPVLLLWSDRLDPFIRPLDRYFEEAAMGMLPNVVMVDPDLSGDLRTDCHPHGDTRVAERFLLEVFAAFAQSPQWDRRVFVVVFDEWGGFFDHVAPPVLRDDNSSPHDADNFGQAGFRVPAVLASPYARRGFVDHCLYDHTSILRFIEWRFLGAPPEGPGQGQASWSLTRRDRFATTSEPASGRTNPSRKSGSKWTPSPLPPMSAGAKPLRQRTSWTSSNPRTGSPTCWTPATRTRRSPRGSTSPRRGGCSQPTSTQGPRSTPRVGPDPKELAEGSF